MGAGSSTNNGAASRSRFSSWGSSIDEAICGDNALCGDYPEDDLEGFPLISEKRTDRDAAVVYPYIEATPRPQPKLRRALSEGEPVVRRAFTTDYSDNSDDPDTDDEAPPPPRRITRRRSVPAGPVWGDHDDFGGAAPLPLSTGMGGVSAGKRRPRKKAPKREPPPEGRRPFSPSQLRDIPLQQLPVHEKRLPETRRRFSESRTDLFSFEDPSPVGFITKPKKKKPKQSETRSLSPTRLDHPEWSLPSQVPPPVAPLKPIRKKQSVYKEPNYKVPQESKKRRPKKPVATRVPKAPSYGVPTYTGQPTSYDSIIKSAPPVRKGARIKAPLGAGGDYVPSPFVVGRSRPTRTPYLVSQSDGLA